MAKEGGNLLYFATWQVANKSELNASASIIHMVYLIDADIFNSDLFSHHFNDENSYKKCLVIIVLAQSTCRIYSNSYSLFKVCQM